MKIEFSRQILEIKYEISKKFFQWEPSFFLLADGETDMTKLTVAFRNFVKAPKNSPGFSEHRITRYLC